MTSKLSQRCTSALACVAIAVLLAVVIVVWVQFSQGAFRTKQHTSVNMTATAERQFTSIKPKHKEFIEKSHIDVGSDADVEYVKPLKTSPLPLHDHDIIFNQMTNNNVADQPTLRHHSGHFRHQLAEVWDPHPHYEINAFGHKLRLELAYNDKFVGPDLHITHIWDNYTQRVPQDPRMSSCFYTGTVQGDPDSDVAVSLCNGMTGYIRTSDNYYYIEPVEKFKNDTLSSFLHRIKKVPHSFKLSNEVTAEETDHCGTNELENHNIIEDQFPIVMDRKEHILNKRTMEKDKRKPFKSIAPPFDKSKRKKREADWISSDDDGSNLEYFIKVLVVADKSMAEYHKTPEELKFYILTLMSQTARLYKDATIGNAISLSVIDIKVLVSKDFKSDNSQVMLRKFCEWQKKHAIGVDHDVALLLTRDYCTDVSQQACITLGVAEVGSMCSRSSSCAIAIDKGLSTSYTIAHEIGHTLSMPHDDDRRCTSFNAEPKLNIMSKMIESDTKPWLWSACSKHFLTEFLESNKSKCMLRAPNRNFIPSNFAKLPGEMFEVDRQCQLVFGSKYKTCSYMPACERLWCTEEGGEEGCKTQHMPWAEGTFCGYDMWCQHKVCVPLNRQQLAPITGGWGQWQPWGVCSRTCGGGVMISKRSCDSPVPQYEGDYCHGKGLKYSSCNAEACDGDIDFRAVQCADFNGITKNLPNLTTDVEWVPKYGLDQTGLCNLYCRPKQSNAYYLLKEKVVDGTKCGLNSFDICVNGICKPGGCDNKLNSKVILDDCGICGGDNSQCEEILGSYNISSNGYHRIVKFPKGCSHLNIRQREIITHKTQSRSYLALVDGDTGKYILNGNNIISAQAKDIIFGSTIIKYNGSDTLIETIRTGKNDKLTKDLILEVLGIDNSPPPDVTYRYIIGKDNAPRYGWILYQKQWSKCSSICSGTQYMRPVCVELSNSHEVDDYHCADRDTQGIVHKQDCNTHCRLSWTAYSKSECSVNCGTGKRSVYYNCMKMDADRENYVNPSNQDDVVNERHCSILPKPPSVEPCVGPCDSARWDYSEWSECTKTCGGGLQKRTAKCINNHNQVIDESHCGNAEKITEQICRNQKCPVWFFSEWSACSVTCGRGFKTKGVYCHIDGRIYNNQLCDSSTKPEDKMECYEKPCAAWSAESWTDCSATCDSGVQSRKVLCKALEDNRVVETRYCSDLLKPNLTRNCRLRECEMFSPYARRYHYRSDSIDNTINVVYDRADFRWVTGAWSKCTKTCNGGLSSRIVICRNDLGEESDNMCDRQSKPVTSVKCNTFVCPRWQVGGWSECNDSCEKRRLVRCQNETGTIVRDKNCNSRLKPLDTTKCKLMDCPQLTNALPPEYFDSKEDQGKRYKWKVGRWKQCSNTCGKGVRHRNVTCEDTLNDVVLVDQFCQGVRKPKDTRPCQRYRCAHTWIESYWSSCSSTCGDGIRTRNVTCHKVYPGGLLDPNPMPDLRYHRFRRNYCDVYKRPPESARCRDSNCGDVYVWSTGPWKQCSHLCGRKGRQVRQLFCLNTKTRAKSPKRLCPKNFKPPRKRKCNQWRCMQSSCKDIKRELATKENKEYLLTIKGKTVSMYCFKMDTPDPEEYISLPSDGQNYAERYDKRLFDLNSCPSNGDRNDNCKCFDVGPERSGFTRFYKVRLNITSSKIIPTDYTFTNQNKGTRVPYGSAGDCYSKVEGCGQGRFSIDLTGTSFKLSRNVRWENVGSFATSQLHITETTASGKCGGFCGNCEPDPSIGLEVQVT